MIVVRNTFQLKFGHAKDAKALIPQGRDMMKKHGMTGTRFLVDVTGTFYTLEMELTFENLTTYERSSMETMGSPEFGAWYGQFMAHVESGRRDIFSIVD